MVFNYVLRCAVIGLEYDECMICYNVINPKDFTKYFVSSMIVIL